MVDPNAENTTERAPKVRDITNIAWLVEAIRENTEEAMVGLRTWTLFTSSQPDFAKMSEDRVNELQQAVQLEMLQTFANIIEAVRVIESAIEEDERARGVQ